MSQATITLLHQGSLTHVPGFAAAGVACGLKPTGALDLAMIYAKQPCVAAGVFTTNAFRAAPVLFDQALLRQNPAGVRAVVINSGCANACTGDPGLRDAEETATATAQALGIPAGSVAVMSTGVIGARLPMDKIHHGVGLATRERSATVEAGHAAARAIMTTDTRPKECAVQVRTAEGTFTVAGMAKGAGMIHPNMATMLCVVVSDARISAELAQQALSAGVEDSFNMITVDGDTSTNDTVWVMANGTAAMPPITSAAMPLYEAFAQGLRQVLTALAQAVVRDGEGATRFVEITVRGAQDRAVAKQVAMSIARSPLVKTAIYGRDANWGRIICAVGYSGAPIQAERVSVWLGDLHLVRDGAPYQLDEARASEILACQDVPITVDLGQGAAQAVVWTCDFSHQYVEINAHYRT